MCVWVEDADKLDYNSKELKIVYRNRIVDNYLSSNSSLLGLAGVKGQGKTFLIKVKRKLIESNKSIICLPKSRMVDTIDDTTKIDRSLFGYLKDYRTWVKLWKYAICSSILSQKNLVEDLDFELLQLRKNTRRNIQANKKSEPSYVMSDLLGRDIHELEDLLEDTGKLVTIVRGVNQSVCLFFDKLDQGFSHYAQNFNSESVMPLRARNASIWQYAQYGLAESSYDIYNISNHHVKVYFTIRHEALLDTELLNKDKARNIDAYIAKLEYSKDDLKQMYDLYIRNEASENLVSSEDINTMPSKAFIGLETIPHVYVEDITENVFDYIFRHTFKRPYDMMKICRALYLALPNNNSLTDREIRQIVNSEADEILNKYLLELSIFLPCPKDEIDRLLVMLPGNVLSMQLVNQLCNTHYLECDNPDIWRCNQNCDHCTNSQIFTILYNIGLFGYEKQKPYDIESKIVFENIANRILDIHTFNLPIAPYYFLHPALCDKARNIRADCGLPFYVNHDVVVGDNYEVAKDKHKKLYKTIQKIKQQSKKERVFVSSTVFDLTEERAAIKEVLSQNRLHPVLSDASDFNVGSNRQLHSHDVCLDEVQKCKSLIFVIGSEYGGEYSGEKYQKEKDEIVTLSKGKIDKPSISLMEFYIARKKHLNCYVFASSEIEQKKKSNILDNKLKSEINFVNHFRLDVNDPIRGNWINWYRDTSDLKTRVSHCKFY